MAFSKRVTVVGVSRAPTKDPRNAAKITNKISNNTNATNSKARILNRPNNKNQYTTDGDKWSGRKEGAWNMFDRREMRSVVDTNDNAIAICFVRIPEIRIP